MVLSYNVKLNFPDKETELAMLDCLKMEADCYGYVSALLETTGFREHPMSRYDVHYKFYYDIRKQYPTLSSQMVCKVIQEVVANWKTCLQSGEDFSTPKKTNLSMLLDKRLGTRYYAADGLVLDADWNASINIANRYHPSTFTLPICGRLNLLGRPLSTGQSREHLGFTRGFLKPTGL